MFNNLIWISFLCVTNIQSAKKKASTPCPGSNYAQLEDTCYYFYDNAKTWWNAQLFCEENGGTLLIFQERDEIKLVKREIKKKAKNLQDTAKFWLGLKHNADDDKFYWADGSDLTRRNWINRLDSKITIPGQCVVIQAKENSGAGAKKWETRSCEEKLPFVCEIELSMSRWSVWSSWSECSSSCGPGRKTRRRKCLRPTSASDSCSGISSETSSCNKASCPVEEWKQWTEWGGCSVTCGDGQQTRERTCSNTRKSCNGNSKENRKCTKDTCPDWSKWSNWGSCSVTCGEGRKERSRQCLNSKRGSECSGNSQDTTSCTQTPCPAWSEWSNWGSCSVTCGEGEKERSRQCLNSKRGRDCAGRPKDTAKCTTTPCPEWSEWLDWSSCSTSCGEGQQTRNRRCINSINNGECKGNSQITRSCSQADCPEWGEWSKWSKCSATCGVGKRERQRKCLNSKLGSNCRGNSKETTECVQASCPDWSEWSSWGSCSVACGEGKKERSRQCLNSKRRSGCSGNSQDTTSCTQTPCPDWEVWSEWSSCSVTCGNGKRTRTRSCLNGDTCSGRSRDTSDCTTEQCPEWDQWTNWGPCTVTCGLGTRNRSRNCLNSRKCKGKSKDTESCRKSSKCPVAKKNNGRNGKRKKMRNKKISAQKTKNKGIVGYEIYRTQTSRVVRCALTCLRVSNCRSINFQFRRDKTKDKKTSKEERLCILNSVSLIDEPSSLEPMPGFKMYDIGEFSDTY